MAKTQDARINVWINSQLAEASIKQLRSEAGKLRSEIANLTPGTAEFVKKSKELDIVKGRLNDITGAAKQQKSAFDDVKKTLAGVFAVDQVISFGKASIEAFMEAEHNAHQLRMSLQGNEESFNRLMDQSAELQENGIFSDDDIQIAQKVAAQYGLTANEIERIIPIIADFAAATGQDLNSALEAFIKGTEGSERALKLYGIQVDSAASRGENFNSILDQMTKFSGANSEALETNAGKLANFKNRVGDLMEVAGEWMLSIGAFNIFNPDTWDGSIRKVNFMKIGLDAAAESFKKMANEAPIQKLEEMAAASRKMVDEVKKELATEKELTQERRETLEFQLKGYNLALRTYTQKLEEKKRKELEAMDVTKMTIEQLKQLDTIAARDELDRRKKVEDEKQKEYDKTVAKQGAALEKLKGLLDQFNDDTLKDTARTEQEKLLVWKQEQEKKLSETYNATGKSLEAKKVFDAAMLALNNDYLAKKDKADQDAAEKEEKRQKDLMDAAIKVAEDEAAAKDAITQKEFEQKLAIEKKYYYDRGASLEQQSAGRIAQMTDEMNYELSMVKDNTELQGKIKHDYYRKIKEEERSLLRAQLQGAQQYLNAIMGIYDSILMTIKNNQDAALANASDNMDREKEKLVEQLENKQISQEEYNRKVKQIEDDYNAKRREYMTQQFEREKTASIIKASINTAVEVTKQLANPILAGLIAIAGAAQVAVIASQPTPQFAKGGHTFAPGGYVNKPFMALAGEAGPEWIAPNWMLSDPKTVNVLGALESYRQNRSGTGIPAFASGGPTGASPVIEEAGTQAKQSDAALIATLNNLNATLRGGIFARLNYDQFKRDVGQVSNVERGAGIVS